MHLRIFYLKSIYILSFFILLLGCQLKEPQQNHGILFLENRSAKLKVDVSNQNDVIKSIGHPHSKSINDENEWFFVERTLTKGEFHKLGKNILKESNILILKFEIFYFIMNLLSKFYYYLYLLKTFPQGQHLLIKLHPLKKMNVIFIRKKDKLFTLL